VTVRRLQLLALAVALGLLGGQPAAADPPTLAKPTVSGPPSWTQAPSAQLTFTSPDAGVTFVCRSDGSNWAACTSPVDYTGLSEGPHTFSVEAVAGSESSTPSGWSWTVDQTPPSLPADVIVEAASPLGTVVTLTAHDNLDPSPALSCTPSQASAFPLGNTDLSCIAQDAAGNPSSPGSVSVKVVDTTAPVLAPHANVVAAQDSASGASVAYGLPTVSDAGDPHPAVTCSPASGSTFPIGTTQVACAATDGSGNHSAQLVFDVVVQHGSSPPPPTLTSTLPAATKRTDATFAFDVAGGAALACRLDGPPGAGTFAPCSSPKSYAGLADGSYLFTVRATNAIGNVSEASRAWVVDTNPPLIVRGLRTNFGDDWIGLSWLKHSDVDFDRVVISRRRAGTSHWNRIATLRRSTAFRDSNVRNDVRYVYALRSIDRVGNRSAAAKVEGRASRILRPGYDAVRSAPPLIDWVAVRRATYFNMQLWYQGRKLLSVWPEKSSYRLRASWIYAGRRHTLSSGRYLVYVWPGFGAKAAAHYGSLVGWTAFRMR
jgi:HYR domain-containing protein